MFKYPIIRLVRLEDTPYGGAENYLRRLSAVLTQRQIAHEALHSKAPRWLASWIRILWFNYQTKRWKKDQFYFSLARITCPDIYRAGDGVHRVYMKIKGATWWPNPLHFIYCMLEKRCFEHAKKIIANSQMVKQQIIETYHTAPEKISVVYNGIDWPTVDETTRRKVLRASLYIPLDKKVILFAGCDFRRKGLDSFFSILQQLKNDYRAIVVGDDKFSRQYHRLAEQLGIHQKIQFLGKQKNINDYYAMSDIFLLPSRYDPFANVILEAMALNNAVITTQQNGASEILQSEFVMKNTDDKAIVAVIDRLLRDDIYLTATKKANQTRARGFSIEKNVQETLAVIESCLSTS